MASKAAEQNNEPDWVSLQAYARHYKVSESGVRKWLREGRLRYVRMGSDYRLDLNVTPT
jgi:excisionase family DNA binding protein